MKKIISLVIIIAFCCGCEKEKPVVYSTSLIGEWTWLMSCGGFTGGCTTPKSSNQKITLVFTIDSIYNFYLNDTLRESITFHTYKSISPDFMDTVNVIKFGFSNQIYSINRDTLYLDDSNIDGFSSSYKRFR